MNESILLTIKKLLGLDPEYTVFDKDIIAYTNSTFPILNELGIGPDETFHITGDTETWNDFMQSDVNLLTVQTYIALRVRILFDPPSSSYVLSSLESEAQRYEFYLSVYCEDKRSTASDDTDGGDTE